MRPQHVDLGCSCDEPVIVSEISSGRFLKGFHNRILWVFSRRARLPPLRIPHVLVLLIVCRLIGIHVANISPMAPSEMNDRELLAALGQRLKSIRQRKRWSQEDLAERSGLHRTYVGGLERGERNIGLVNLFKLVRALDVAVEDLL